MSERRDNLSFAETVRDLVYYPLPRPHFGDVAGRGEVSDGGCVLGGQ